MHGIASRDLGLGMVSRDPELNRRERRQSFGNILKMPIGCSINEFQLVELMLQALSECQSGKLRKMTFSSTNRMNDAP
jgi:hypothetical protein